MKQRSNEYYALITPELLFNLNGRFKNFYTPWVYIYLRLDYMKYIKDLPDQYFKIDRKSICEFFNIHPATISRAFGELLNNGLMEEQNRKFKVPFKLDKTFFKEIEGYPEYILINNNFMIEFNQRINNEYEKFGKKDRTPIKVLEIFHYLITKNHHIMVDTPVYSSKETANSINQSLNHDINCVKNYLEILQTMGYIEMDEDYNIINTVYGYGKRPKYKKNISGNRNVLSNSQKQDTIEVRSIPAEDNCAEDKIEAIENTIPKQHKPEPITDIERIKLFEMMSNGNKEKLINLLEKSNIDRNVGIEYFKNRSQQKNLTIN